MAKKNKQLFNDVSMTPTNPKWSAMTKRPSELYNRNAKPLTNPKCLTKQEHIKRLLKML